MNEFVSLLRSATVLFAEMSTPQLIFLGGLFILVLILMTRSRRHFARKGREQRGVATSAQPSSPPAHHREKPGEFERWEVEMQELARELSAQLDSKMVALQHLVRDAEAATTRLQATLGASDKEPTTVPFSSAAPARRAAAEPAHPPDTFHAAYGPAGEGVRHLNEGCLTPSEDPRYRAIYALADQGLSRDVIARRVGTPAGEVDLILSLRGKK